MRARPVPAGAIGTENREQPLDERRFAAPGAYCAKPRVIRRDRALTGPVASTGPCGAVGGDVVDRPAGVACSGGAAALGAERPFARSC